MTSFAFSSSAARRWPPPPLPTHAAGTTHSNPPAAPGPAAGPATAPARATRTCGGIGRMVQGRGGGDRAVDCVRHWAGRPAKRLPGGSIAKCSSVGGSISSKRSRAGGRQALTSWRCARPSTRQHPWPAQQQWRRPACSPCHACCRCCGGRMRGTGGGVRPQFSRRGARVQQGSGAGSSGANQPRLACSRREPGTLRGTHPIQGAPSSTMLSAVKPIISSSSRRCKNQPQLTRT